MGENTASMRGKDWIWFSGLNSWHQALIGLAFGIVLLVLFLLPNDLGGYLTIAAVLMVVVATISGFVLARFALDRAWRPADVRRVRKFVVRSAFGLALAIGLLAFLSRSQWVLWLWTGPGVLGLVCMDGPRARALNDPLRPTTALVQHAASHHRHQRSCILFSAAVSRSVIATLVAPAGFEATTAIPFLCFRLP